MNAVLSDAVKAERSTLRRALWAGVLMAISTIGLAGTSGWLIVRSAERPVVLSLTVPMGLVQLFALAKAVARYAERTNTHRAALSIMTHVRTRVATMVSPLVPAGLGPRSGEVVETVIGDVNRVQDLLTAVAGPLFTSLVAGVITVVVSGLIVSWAGLTLLAALVMSGVVVPFGAATWGRRGEDAMDDVRREIYELFHQAGLSNEEMVFGTARAVATRHLAVLEDRYDELRRAMSWRLGVLQALVVWINGACALVTVVVSARALAQHQMGKTLVAVPVLLGVAALELVSAVTPIVLGWGGDRRALERLTNLEHLPAVVSEPAVARPLQHADTIRVHGVSVGYDNTSPTDPVSLAVAPGEVLLIDGPSGVGKTSLALAMAKFVTPSSGAIELQDVNVVQLRTSDVRTFVGFVNDRPHVFETTLAGNLRIARPTATDDDLRRALALAGLDSLVAQMPDGLDTKLGGATAQLSGGEQRRLGVAREYLAERPLIILDEPTEGLDDETAARVLGDLVTRYHDRGVIIISHQVRDRAWATQHLTIGAVLGEDAPLR